MIEWFYDRMILKTWKELKLSTEKSILNTKTKAPNAVVLVFFAELGRVPISFVFTETNIITIWFSNRQNKP